MSSLALEGVGLRIGITMRITHASAYEETRDSLAHDWFDFFESVMPGVQWFPLPNIGSKIIATLDQCQINGLILSGGDSAFEKDRRYDTENALLTWAEARKMPVLGVCRGFQRMQAWFKGQMTPFNGEGKQRHVGARHVIEWGDGQQAEVNSYHEYGIPISSLAPPLSPLAIDHEDQTVEAAKFENLLGLMWHPEREKNLPGGMRALILSHFLQWS